MIMFLCSGKCENITVLPQHTNSQVSWKAQGQFIVRQSFIGYVEKVNLNLQAKRNAASLRHNLKVMANSFWSGAGSSITPTLWTVEMRSLWSRLSMLWVCGKKEYLSLMRFHHRVSGPFLRYRKRSLVIKEGLRVELLLPQRLRYLIQMPPGRLPCEVFQAYPTRWRPLAGGGGDYVSQMTWKHLRISTEELDRVEVERERELWASLLRPAPRPSSG